MPSKAAKIKKYGQDDQILGTLTLETMSMFTFSMPILPFVDSV